MFGDLASYSVLRITVYEPSSITRYVGVQMTDQYRHFWRTSHYASHMPRCLVSGKRDDYTHVSVATRWQVVVDGP